MTKGEPSRRRQVTGLAIIATAVAYVLAAQPGVFQQLGASGEATLVWPASGVGLAALLFLGVDVWSGVALGSFLTTVESVGHGPVVALGVAVGTTGGVLLAFGLLRRMGFNRDLARVRDAMALVWCAAVAGMVVDSAARSGVLVLAGVEPARDYWALVLRSWLGAGLGVLVVTPLLLVLPRLVPHRTEVWRLAEASGLFLCTLGVTWGVVAGGHGGEELFLVFPLLIWAAWRFQLVGGMPCVLAVSVITVYAAVQNLGPFSDNSAQSALITSQAFVAVVALSTLFLAVAVTERNAARDEIGRASRELVKAVNTLDERLRPKGLLNVARTQEESRKGDPRETRTESIGQQRQKDDPADREK